MAIRRRGAALLVMALGLLALPPAEASAVASPHDRFAVLVGITDYRSPTQDTVGGVGDVEHIRKVLLDRGWRNDRIMVLTGSNATGGNIRAGLQWLVDNSRERETFSFFHYSGHVKQTGGHEYLWPIDRDFVSDTAFARTLKQIRGRSWIDISGCEGGGFEEGIADSQALFTASSRGNQKSYEYPPWRMSVWTGLLFQEGIEKEWADPDRDGSVNVHDVLGWAVSSAQSMTSKQRPYGAQKPLVKGDRAPLDLAAPTV